MAWAQRVAHEALGNDFVFRLAVHDAPASDGGRNINMHLMFSDRRLDGIERDRELFFKRAAAPYRHRKTGQLVTPDPATGGTQKDRFWNHKSRPKWARSLFERHVQLELPGFKLSKSKNPEPKIGPKVKKAGEEREAQRRAIETTVLNMRALRRALEAVDSDLTELQNTPLAAPTMSAPTVKRSAPSWLDFERAVHSIARHDLSLNDASLSAILAVCKPRFTELTSLVVDHGKSVEELALLLIEQMAREGVEDELSELPVIVDANPNSIVLFASLEGHSIGDDAGTDPRWPEFETALMEIGTVEFNISWLLLDHARRDIKSRFVGLANEMAQKGLGVISLARSMAVQLNREELGFDADIERTDHENAADLSQSRPEEPGGPS